jgi:hypothetical protein
VVKNYPAQYKAVRCDDTDDAARSGIVEDLDAFCASYCVHTIGHLSGPAPQTSDEPHDDGNTWRVDWLSRPRTTTEASVILISSGKHTPFASMQTFPSSHVGLYTWVRLPIAVFILAFCKSPRTSRPSCALFVIPSRSTYMFVRLSRISINTVNGISVRDLPVKRCRQG